MIIKFSVILLLTDESWKMAKPNFIKIWQLIQQIDAAVGVFIFRNSSEKKSLKEKILALTMPSYIFILVLFSTSTLIITKFALVSIVFVASLLTPTLSLYISLKLFIWSKDELKYLIQWCENLYDTSNKLLQLVPKSAETHLFTVERQTVKFLKWMIIFVYVDCFGLTFGYAVIGMFLPESIYPKFSPPVPYYLPFKEQQTWHAFIANVLVQTLVSVHTATLTNFIYGMFLCICLHILGYLEIIEEIVVNMKHKNLNETSFIEQMKIITDMVSEVNSTIIAFNKLFNKMWLLSELASLGSLFICGLTFIIIRQNYLFAIGITFVNFIFLSVCYVNEKILDKLDSINEALYDIPWYELSTQEKKMLLITLNCDKIQGGLTAAGIHTLTIERFGTNINAGYTNLLVLKDLIQK